MRKHVQDELPGIDWEQVAKDYASVDDMEYNEEDEEPTAVAEAFDRGDEGVTAAVPQTAFIVIVTAEGDAEAYGTIDGWPERMQRPATLGDMRRGCSEIVTEINLQAGARFTLDGLTDNGPKPADVVREALKRRRGA